jgi:hypothetical protein
MTHAKTQSTPGGEKNKLETRNPKLIQMIKKHKILNEPVSDVGIGNSDTRVWIVRISIFGFRILFRWRLGARKFLQLFTLRFRR